MKNLTLLADCIQSVEESIRGTDACLQSYVDEQENLQELDFASISDNE